MMCRLGTPALDHRVMTVVLMLWFVFMVENPATLLIFFIMFFRSNIWLQILEKRTALRVDLFKIELKHLVAIVTFGWFVHPSFFLVTGRVMDTTWMVLWSFIMGHGYKFTPGCIGCKLEAVSGESSLPFTASSAEEKANMVSYISKKRKRGRKRENATGL